MGKAARLAPAQMNEREYARWRRRQIKIIRRFNLISIALSLTAIVLALRAECLLL